MSDSAVFRAATGLRVAALAAAALVAFACGDKDASRSGAPAGREDSALAAGAGGPKPESWGDFADSVFEHHGLQGFGATWTEVTAALGPPGSVEREVEDDDTVFIAAYFSGNEAGYEIRPLLLEFRSMHGGIRKLTRAYWNISDEHGARELPGDYFKTWAKLTERVRSWGDNLDEVEAARGPGLSDTLPVDEIERVGGVDFRVHARRDYPGATFRFGDDGRLLGVEWIGTANLVAGFRAGMSRYQVVARMGLPWSATGDARDIARTRPGPQSPAVWSGRGDSVAAWLYVTGEDPLEYLVFSMRQDTVTSISWWSTPLWEDAPAAE